MNEQEERKHCGRRKISDMKRDRPSKRAILGKLDVMRETCPFCHHHKVFDNSMFKKCTRCHTIIKYY